jgi:hypothetical protein
MKTKIISIGLYNEKYWHNYSVFTVLNMFDKFTKCLQQKKLKVIKFKDIYKIGSVEQQFKKFYNDIANGKFNNCILFFHMFYGHAHIIKRIGNWNTITKRQNIKKILYFNDTQTNLYINAKTMNFFDALLFPSLVFVKRFYSQYLGKIHHFPFSFDSVIMRGIKFDINKRKKKLLIYGTCHKTVYPLRTELVNHITSKENKIKNVDILKSFGSVKKKSHDIVGKNLFIHLSTYLGAIATSSCYPLDYMVAKYVEILGSGCLGLFEFTTELDVIGLKPFVHYIPINTVSDGYFTKHGTKKKGLDITNINLMIDKYLGTSEGEKIRLDGFIFVKKYLTDRNRMEQLMVVIDKLR